MLEETEKKEYKINDYVVYPKHGVGKVKEISAVISMLASEDGSYITGQNIRVDGGITRSV